MDRLSLLNAVRLGTLVAQEGQGEVDALDFAECWERLASELLRKGTLNDTGLLIVVPDHRSDQVSVLNERLRRKLSTRRLLAVTSARFIKMVTGAVNA